MSDTVAEKKVVFFNYVLKDNDGNVIDASKEGQPLPYLHGAGNIVPGLEKQMAGKAVGDSFDAKVTAKEGYGERMHETFELPRGQFPADADLQPGMSFLAQDPQGQQFPVWIKAVTDETVTIDPNHPLAGVDLNFAVEIASIRDATDEELQHGHPHGPGGHAH